MQTLMNTKPDFHGRIENTKALFARTNVGAVTFYCNTGNKYEAIKQLKDDFGVVCTDVHHATYIQV